MDGGIAGTHIYGAIGYRMVLAITAFPARTRTSQEAAVVGASRGEVVHVVSDAEPRAALGPNRSDVSRAGSAAAAGVRQAAEIAPALREEWTRS
jgi:hypothetical protein